LGGSRSGVTKLSRCEAGTDKDFSASQSRSIGSPLGVSLRDVERYYVDPQSQHRQHRYHSDSDDQNRHTALSPMLGHERSAQSIPLFGSGTHSRGNFSALEIRGLPIRVIITPHLALFAYLFCGPGSPHALHKKEVQAVFRSRRSPWPADAGFECCTEWKDKQEGQNML